jgi:hypothetical protein
MLGRLEPASIEIVGTIADRNLETRRGLDTMAFVLLCVVAHVWAPGTAAE